MGMRRSMISSKGVGALSRAHRMTSEGVEIMMHHSTVALNTSIFER